MGAAGQDAERSDAQWEVRWAPVLRRLARGLLLLAAFEVAALGAWERCMPGGWCPDPNDLEAYQPYGTPLVLDREGREIGDLHPLQRTVVPIDSVPAHLPNALIAVEDRRFHHHRGIDWIRVPAAVLRRQGASTISMQLARTLYPDLLPRQERTLRRKFQEMRIAVEIERRFTKDEVLELYLNHVYFGAGRYGMAEAAHYFFGRGPADLGPEQAALLAGLARAPANFDPREHPERARERRDLVLRLMEEQGHFTPEEAAEARERPLGVLAEAPPRVRRPAAAWFLETVRVRLGERFDEELIRRADRIHTTLDLDAQEAAQDELARQLARIEAGEFGGFDGEASRLEGAVVVLDPATGDVLALVGGRDFGDSSFNRATHARRQVGSAFKPFVYAAALAEGFLQSQPIADMPFELQLRGEGPLWSPRNYDGRFRGRVNMREALVHSVNVPAARMAMAVGLDAVVRQARAAGIDAAIPETPAAALGTASVTPLEMARAFATLAALGERPALRFVERIEGAGGEILYEVEPRREPAIDPRVAYIVTDMLSDVVDRGTGMEVRRAGFQGAAAGKTGTTQEAHDAWFVGYTPDLVASVWIGFDEPRGIMPGATGGILAAPVWGRLMARLYEEREAPEPWIPPEGVLETAVDPVSGMYVQDGCRPHDGGTIRVLFLEEHQPQATCPVDAGWLNRLRRLIGGSPDPESPDVPGARAFELDSPVQEILGASRVPARGSGR